jgi:KDO2-lipid IV(A) lauroyltransferase
VRLLDRFVILPLLRLFNRLAADTACRVGGGVGVLAWRLGVRRRVAAEAVSETLGLRGRARARVLRRSYATIGASFLELFTIGGPDGPERHVRLANPLWQAWIYRRHQGCVFITPHLGNWDIAAGSQRRFVPRLLAYAKAQHNAAVDAYVNELRARAGIEVLFAMNGDRTSALTVLRALRQGAPLGLLADQRPWAEHGAPGYFLGVPTWCLPGAGFFAERCKVPLIPGMGVRVRAGRTVVFIGRPIAPCGNEAVTMQTGLDALSAIIAAFPGQYFWQHKRFKVRLDLPPRAAECWRERKLHTIA